MPTQRKLNQYEIARRFYPDDKNLHKKVLRRIAEEKMERAKAAGYGGGKEDLGGFFGGSQKIPWDYIDFEKRQNKADEEGSKSNVVAEAGSIMAKMQEAERAHKANIEEMRADGYMVGDFPLRRSHTKFKEQQSKANEEGSDYIDEDKVEEGSLAALMLAAEKAQRDTTEDDDKKTKKTRGNK